MADITWDEVDQLLGSVKLAAVAVGIPDATEWTIEHRRSETALVAPGRDLHPNIGSAPGSAVQFLCGVQIGLFEAARSTQDRSNSGDA